PFRCFSWTGLIAARRIVGRPALRIACQLFPTKRRRFSMSRIYLMFVTVLSGTALVTLAPAADEKKADGKPVVLFNGKDLTGWKVKGSPAMVKWVVGKSAMDEKNQSKLTATPGEGGEMINAAHGGDIYTEEKFGDGTIDVEFMIPKGSNSG